MENQIQLQLHQFFIINYNYVIGPSPGFVQLLGKAKGLGMSFRFSLFVNVFAKSTKKAVEVQQNFPEFVL